MGNSARFVDRFLALWKKLARRPARLGSGQPVPTVGGWRSTIARGIAFRFPAAWVREENSSMNPACEKEEDQKSGCTNRQEGKDY